MNNNFSQALEIYRRTGDLCAYFNITQTTKSDVDNLAGKLAFLEAQNGANQNLLEFIFPSFGHQIAVAKCAFANYQQKMPSQSYYNSTLIWYEERGVMLPFLPWVILPSIFALISILLNASLIFVTAKRISLSKLCNSLILFDSFCQIGVVLPFLVNFFSLIAGIPLVHFNVCLFVLMFSTGCSYAAFLAIFFISLERLLIVFFPIRMHTISPSTVKICSLIVSFICLLFGSFTTFSVFNVWTIINLPYYRSLLCNTGLYSDVLNTPTSYAILVLSLLNYSLIFAKLLCHQRGNALNSEGNEERRMNKGTRRMLRSVFIISAALLIGWLLVSAARNQVTDLIHAFSYWIVPFFVSDTSAANTISGNLTSFLVGLVTCLSMIAAGIGAPILIFCNLEYRNAYKATFNAIWRSKTSVGPLFTIQETK